MYVTLKKWHVLRNLLDVKFHMTVILLIRFWEIVFDKMFTPMANKANIVVAVVVIVAFN